MVKSIPNCTCQSVCGETVYPTDEKWVNLGTGGAKWSLFL